MTAAAFLREANELLGRTTCDPYPVTSVTYALGLLCHCGPRGGELRQRWFSEHGY